MEDVGGDMAAPIVESEMEKTFTFELRAGDRKVTAAMEGLEALSLTIDGRPVAAAGVAHMFWYGVKQAIADGAAASKDTPAADQLAKFEKRLDNLIAGTIREVGERNGSTERREVATAIVVAVLKKQGRTCAKGSDGFKALVDEALTLYADRITQVIARRRAEEAELASLAE